MACFATPRTATVTAFGSKAAGGAGVGTFTTAGGATDATDVTTTVCGAIARTAFPAAGARSAHPDSAVEDSTNKLDRAKTRVRRTA
ncbi:hypothetical protein Acsp05_46700 [Actinokineospora sp. NBRC 105648]|nr:hypothetical protein Acsp05_46700 [Actinokineospora sp. NBRC 105648]